MENMQIFPFPKNVLPQYVELKVPLYSHGCERKVKKALSHLKGIYSVEVHHECQKVTVWGICNRDTVLAAVKKKRTGSHFWDHEEDTPEQNSADESEFPTKVRGRAVLDRAFQIRKTWKLLLLHMKAFNGHRLIRPRIRGFHFQSWYSFPKALSEW